MADRHKVGVGCDCFITGFDNLGITEKLTGLSPRINGLHSSRDASIPANSADIGFCEAGSSASVGVFRVSARVHSDVSGFVKVPHSIDTRSMQNGFRADLLACIAGKILKLSQMTPRRTDCLRTPSSERYHDGSRMGTRSKDTTVSRFGLQQ